jgi:hypothetical protein
MAFDVLQTIKDFAGPLLAIPGAIKNIRDLLSAPKPDIMEAQNKLCLLTRQIAVLGTLSSWLREAKQAHEELQRLDTFLGDVNIVYQNAFESGRFNFAAYDVERVRRTWQVVKPNALESVLTFAQNIERIEGHPLVRNSDDQFVSGPAWCKGLLDRRDLVDSLLTKHSKAASSKTIEQLADSMNNIVVFTKSLLLEADQSIRKQAAEMGELFAQLSGAMQ